MANTYDAGLVQEILSDVAITTLGPVLAKVDSFTLNVGVDPMKPKSTVNVPVVTAGSTVLTDPANFEAGDATVTNAQVTVNHKSVPFHATQDEMNIGYRVQNLLQKNMQEIGNAIQDIIFTPVTEANFGAAAVDVDPAAFAADDLKLIWAAAKDFRTRNLALDGGAYSRILPTDSQSFRPSETGAFGFDKIMVNNRWDGAEANVMGFCGDRSAIAIATGEPYMSANVQADLSSLERVVLPNGIVVLLCGWISRATRAEWMSLDLMIGATAGDTTAGVLVMDGTV